MGKGDTQPEPILATVAIHVFPLLVAKVITSDGITRETDSNGYIQYVKSLGSSLGFRIEAEGYNSFSFDYTFNCLWWDYDVHLVPLVNDNDLITEIDNRYDVIDKDLFENAILIQDRTIKYTWGDINHHEDNLASVVRVWVNLMWGSYCLENGFETVDKWCKDLPSDTAETVNADMAVSNLLSYTTPHNWVYSGGKDSDGISRWPKQFAILEELYGKTCPEIITEKIFNKLGGSYNAWMISDGTMRISSSIRDLYKFARLIFNKGKWNGEPIISQEYVQRTLAGGPNGNGSPFNLEGYQTHLIKNGSAWEMEDALPGVPDGFMARSSKSYIIGIPSLELIMAGKGPEQLQSAFLPQVCELMKDKMNNEAIIAIGGVVGSLSKFAMMATGITGRYMTLIALVVTTGVFAIWGYSHGDFARETTWDYFTAWVNTLGLAVAGFHGTEEAVKKVTGTGGGN